jgi:hypothetical protein
MELSLNDLENIDNEKETRRQIDQIQTQIRGLATRLAFPPSLHGAIGGAAIGGSLLGGKGFGYIAGAGLGYLLLRNKVLTETDRQVLVNKIGALREELATLQEALGESGDGRFTGIMSSNELVNYNYRKYNFTGEWHDLFGDPSKNFHMMIYGSPKQGKSILAVQFARYLSENFGEVLYIASEEGFSATLQQKVKEFAMDNGNLDFANFREYEQVAEAVKEGTYDFVFIDSVNYIRMTPEQVEQLKALNPRMALITIQQSTKDGKYKGDTAYAHNCDIIVRVSEGVAYATGRFAAPAEMNIFDMEETEE